MAENSIARTLTCRVGYDVRVLLEALDAVAAERQRGRLVVGRRQSGHAAIVVLGVLVVLGPAPVAQLQR